MKYEFLHHCKRSSCLCEWRATYAEARCPRCNCADVRVERVEVEPVKERV